MARTAYSLTNPVRPPLRRDETTSAYNNEVRDPFKQIAEEVHNLKFTVISVVRESMDDNYSNGDNSRAETDASEDTSSRPAILEGEDAGTERKSATA